MALLSKVEALESENAALRGEVSELRSRLNLNSKNSHKPPSSDGLSKKPGLPKGPPKKSGGQFGHKGKTLKMVDAPDAVVIYQLLGLVYERIQNYQEAIDIYEEFLRIFPDSSDATAIRSFISCRSRPTGAVRFPNQGVERSIEQRLQTAGGEDRTTNGRPVGLFV